MANIWRCPNCMAGQGEIGKQIKYIRKGGTVEFEPFGVIKLTCYACKSESYWKRDSEGRLVQCKNNQLEKQNSVVIKASDR